MDAIPNALIERGFATYGDLRRARAWAQQVLYADQHGTGKLPVCAACGLIRGLGFRTGVPGHGAWIPDPAPRDRGRRRGGRWFCTSECRDGFPLLEGTRWSAVMADAVARLDALATPGPLRAHEDGEIASDRCPPDGAENDGGGYAVAREVGWPADRAWIVLARYALPAASRRIAELEAELVALRQERA